MKVLFVCTGNICRSPTAEGVFRAIVEAEGLGGEIEADSAGTHGYHIGEPPDARSIKAASTRGFDLSGLRARKVTAADFARFDLILAMDRGHFAFLESLRPKDARAQVRLFLAYHPDSGQSDVPDPYYGGPAGFEEVLDLVDAASRNLLAEIRTRYRR